MVICAAQNKSIKGDIDANIDAHKKFIDLAVAHLADIIIFPELSLTGYDSRLAKSLAVNADDERLDIFQQLSNQHNIIIGVGMPTKANDGICISMILFHPNGDKQVYSKYYLHADEVPFFMPGQNDSNLLKHHPEIALSICYEVMVAEHAAEAFKNNATIYLSSVAKTLTGVDKAAIRIAEIAAKYQMQVVMANCTGEADGEMCAGKSAAWNNNGILVGQLNTTGEGLLLFDTITNNATQVTLNG